MMKPSYQAEIRWAVMEEGKQGLRAWKDAVYFFMSESQDAAFQYALQIGYRECTRVMRKTASGLRLVWHQIVSLDLPGKQSNGV